MYERLIVVKIAERVMAAKSAPRIARKTFWVGALWGVALMAARGGWAQVAPEIPTVPVPATVDVFNLDLAGTQKYSSSHNFELLGHSYFKVPERTDWAKGKGRAGEEIGSGFNTVRVYDGIAYLAGYNSPPSLFGILLADINDPKDLKPLSFIPCDPPGARCTYLRVNRLKKILMFGSDLLQPGSDAKTGWFFYDVSNPRKPVRKGFVPVAPGAKTHGMDADDRYLYGCGQYRGDLSQEAVQIIDYSDPSHPKQVATWHVPGQIAGEEPGPLDRRGPDGKPQILMCHEIVYYNDRLYIGYRDAGMKILDVTDRTNPRLLATFDYVPPFHGGYLGAAHTVAPVVVEPGKNPDLVVMTDEIFDCPVGFGRILDISDLKNPEVIAGTRPANVQMLSTFRAPHIDDAFDYARKDFVCPKGGGPLAFAGNMTIGNTTHLPWFDRRSPSLVYITWYDEGVRVMDISNPYVPTFLGYYLSPHYAAPGRGDRHTRELFQDPDTDLLYVTDGNGGGLTVLRYVGPVPPNPPLPGAR
jgi:hypothetical protein